MHELSITQELIRKILKESKYPKKVVIELGDLTSYKKEPLLFYFDALKKDEERLKDAKIQIIQVPGKILCKGCNKESLTGYAVMLFCPECKSPDIEIIAGKDVLLKEIYE